MDRRNAGSHIKKGEMKTLKNSSGKYGTSEDVNIRS
jgi:hypothetical protein